MAGSPTLSSAAFHCPDATLSSRACLYPFPPSCFALGMVVGARPLRRGRLMIAPTWLASLDPTQNQHGRLLHRRPSRICT